MTRWNLRVKASGAKRWLMRRKKAKVTPIPSIDIKSLVNREEWFLFAFAIPFIWGAISIISGYSIPLLTEVLGYAYGWIATTVITIFILFALYQIRLNYKIKLNHRTMNYDCIRFSIREMGQEKIQNSTVDIWVQSRKPLPVKAGEPLKDHNGKEILQLIATGEMDKGQPVYDSRPVILTEGINGTLITAAYRKNDDILKHFIIIHPGSMEEHEGITSNEHVYLGWVGVSREVSHITTVMARRGRNEMPLIYITDSSMTVYETLNIDGQERDRQARLKVTEYDPLAIERSYILSQVKKTEEKIETLEADIHGLEAENEDLRRRLAVKEGRKEETDYIMEPEGEPPKKEATWGKRAKQILTILGIIGLFLAAAAFFIF